LVAVKPWCISQNHHLPMKLPLPRELLISRSGYHRTSSAAFVPEQTSCLDQLFHIQFVTAGLGRTKAGILLARLLHALRLKAKAEQCTTGRHSNIDQIVSVFAQPAH